MNYTDMLTKAKERIAAEKAKRKAFKEMKNNRKDQYVVLTVTKEGKVTKMENDWNDPDVQDVFDPEKSATFKTQVDIGKSITWMGIPAEGSEGININIEYILMSNSDGKQVLKNRTYHRKENDVVTGKVKSRNLKIKEIESYYIVYSVNNELHILDPMMEVHGEV